MTALVFKLDAEHPEAAAIARAADVLRAGGLVVFPTETVYGLGAPALDAGAVEKIFEAKGRPATNPVILHVANVAQARPLASTWPKIAEELAKRFWPGPLTLVVPKASIIPSIVTAGGPTVAVRCPAHPTAQALLRHVGFPVAAPSANLSTRLSPTRADHLSPVLLGRVDLVLDAGPAPGGIESTVLDISVDPPRILRPGLISAEQIESLTGPLAKHSPNEEPADQPARSPGGMERHYAPATPLEITSNGVSRYEDLRRNGQRVAWLRLGSSWSEDENIFVMPLDPTSYASVLYATLHDLDHKHFDRILADSPPESVSWDGIRDRLRRASTCSEASE